MLAHFRKIAIGVGDTRHPTDRFAIKAMKFIFIIIFLVSFIRALRKKAKSDAFPRDTRDPQQTEFEAARQLVEQKRKANTAALKPAAIQEAARPDPLEAQRQEIRRLQAKAQELKAKAATLPQAPCLPKSPSTAVLLRQALKKPQQVRVLLMEIFKGPRGTRAP